MLVFEDLGFLIARVCIPKVDETKMSVDKREAALNTSFAFLLLTLFLAI